MVRLGLIPARAGSERLPGKNTIDLGGKPLIGWTIEAARASAIFDEIIIATNDHAVAAIAEKYKCDVLDRPDEVSQPDSPSLDLVRYVQNKTNSDTITLLQPTSPFRSSEDIVNAHKLFEDRGADTVISIKMANSNLVFALGHADRLRPKENSYMENGALYIVSTKHLQAGGDWYSGLTYGYLMPYNRSIDIDTKYDLEKARALLQGMDGG